MTQAQPQHSDPRILEAQGHIRAGAFLEAIEICQGVLAAQANDTDALNTLAIAYAFGGQTLKSIETLAQAVSCEPENTKYKTNFAKAIGSLGAQTVTTDKPDVIKRAIEICLEDEKIAHNVFRSIWYALVMQDRELSALSGFVQNGGFAEQAARVDLARLRPVLCDPFFHLGLKRLISAGGIAFERVMTFLRRYFLHAEGVNVGAFMPFLCALAEQCHFNEYVYACSEGERESVAALERDLSAVDVLDLSDLAIVTKIALLGCYQGIDHCEFAVKIDAAVGQVEDESFANLIALLISDPLRARALQGDIPVLSAIENDVSAAVRGQYEDNPYPRWRCITTPALSAEDRAKGCGKRILIAGCGTGQEILNMALHYPEAEMVTGVDLSLASLAYGKQKAEALGVENVEFFQGDILQLEMLGREFDMISCSGVLHHMQDPILGWEKLLTRLKPNGVIKIALYSEIARQNVTQCWDWIKERGFDSSPEGISAFRQALMELEDTHFLKTLTGSIDFYSMSMCRDLLFHVQEHQFTLPRIQAALDSLGLRLLSMDVEQPGVLQKYMAQYPDDPQAVNLEHWHQFETENPDTFAGMYPFWSHRKDSDSPGEMPDWVFTEKRGV